MGQLSYLVGLELDGNQIASLPKAATVYTQVDYERVSTLKTWLQTAGVHEQEWAFQEVAQRHNQTNHQLEQSAKLPKANRLEDS
jgi:hypothetical protein